MSTLSISRNQQRGNCIGYKFSCLVLSLVMFRFLYGYALIYLGFDYLDKHKFLIDSRKIYFAYNSINYDNLFSFELYDNFNNTARLYRIIFFNRDLEFEDFIVLTGALYLILFLIIVNSLKVKQNHKLFTLVICFFLFDIVFLFMPTKEHFSILLNLLTLKAVNSDKIRRKITVMILFLLYGLFFRQYYLLIGAIYLFLLFLKRLDSTGKAVFIMLAGSCVVFLFYYTDMLDKIINLRYWSVKILGGETNTLIANIIPYGYGEKNILKFSANYIINAVRMLVPLEVLWKSFSRGIVFVPVQLGIHFYIIRDWRALNAAESSLQKGNGSNIRKARKIFVYVTSYFLVSVLFEPDFGSVFRHNMNLMPHIFYLFFQADWKDDLVTVRGMAYENTACNPGNNRWNTGIF